MSRFADYLADRGLVSREDIERATQHQVIYGARLGTNLVELKLIGVEHLAEALSDFHKVPLPPRKWLERPARNAVKRVSRPMVEKIRFIPLRLDGNVLHAAVLDPTDPGALDNLRFATGCRVEPYVLPEIWMHDWLFTLFKIARGIRHVETDAGPGHEDDSVAQERPTASQPGPPPSLRTHEGPSVSGMPAERNTGQIARPAAERSARAHSGRAADPSRSGSSSSDADLRQPVQYSERSPSGSGPGGRTPVGMPRNPGLESAVVPAGRDNPSAGRAAGGDEMVLSIDPGASPSMPTMGASVRPPPVMIKALGELVGNARFGQQAAQASGPAPAAAAPSGAAAAMSSPAHVHIAGPGHVHIPGPGRLPAILAEPEPEMAWERESVADPWPSAELPTAEAPGLSTLERAATKAPAVVGAAELARLERELGQIGEREQLIELSFSIATQFAHTVALFIVQKGTLQGVRCISQGTPRTLDGLLISVELASMLTQAATATEPLRAVPGARALDMRVLQVIGDTNATEVGLFPIMIRQRVVNLLYASNGAEKLGAVAFGALTALSQQMSAGYERLIMVRKGANTNAPVG